MPGGTYAPHSLQAQCFVSAMWAVRVARSGISASHISHRGGFAFGELCGIFSELLFGASPLAMSADGVEAGFEFESAIWVVIGDTLKVSSRERNRCRSRE